MSHNKISQKGFTIVELLIVIVVIGILAAITIVAYNGVTAKANATSAKAAAASVIKKAEAYNAQQNSYPLLPSALTGSSAQSESYGVPSGITIATGTGGTDPNFTTAPTAAPASPSTLIWYACTSPSGAGFRVAWWDYANATPAWTNMTTGGTCTTWTFKSTGATT